MPAATTITPWYQLPFDDHCCSLSAAAAAAGDGGGGSRYARAQDLDADPKPLQGKM
jgi:hypothetical protein